MTAAAASPRWNKAEQLAALRAVRQSADALIAELESTDDALEADTEACWRFPYTPEAGAAALALRRSFTAATRSLVNPVLFILETAGGLNESKSVNALARSQVPDVLAKYGDEGASTAQLANACDLVEDRLRPLLQMAASLGLVTQDAARDDHWQATLHTRMFCKDSPLPLYAVHEWSYAYNSHLLHEIPNALKRENADKSGAQLAFGKSPFEYFSDPANAQVMAHFNLSMKVLTSYLNDGPVLDFPWTESVGNDAAMLDVGGGIGAQIIPLAKRYPKMQFVIQDLPHVCAKAKEFWAAMPNDLSKRVSVQTHDFFTPQPTPTDTPSPTFYLLRWIIHDWDDEKAITLLRNLRRAQITKANETRLVLCEYIVRRDMPRYVAQQLVVMPLYGGKERSESEYAELLQRAGWQLRRVWPTRSHLDVIEAVADGDDE